MEISVSPEIELENRKLDLARYRADLDYKKTKWVAVLRL
jgi:hypothetical protein